SQVDYQLEFGRLMDRQLRGLGPLQNLRGIDAVLAVTLSDAHTVAHQSARDRIFTKLVDRRQPLPRRESDDPIAARIEVRSGCDRARPRALLQYRADGGRQCIVVVGLGYDDPLPDPTRRLFDLLQLERGRREVGINEHADQSDAGYEIAQQPKPLRLHQTRQ